MKVFETVSYQIKKHRRAKHVRIIVKPGGKVVVTAPWRTPKYAVDKLVQEKLAWVLQAREKMSTVQPFKRAGDGVEYKKYKEQARTLFSNRLSELNEHYQFSYKRVSVRNQKTRWGSCSKSGTLSFSYRLLLLPDELRDYVLVHELCHTKEMNHSSRFWQLVGQTMPHYKVLRRKLQTHSNISST